MTAQLSDFLIVLTPVWLAAVGRWSLFWLVALSDVVALTLIAWGNVSWGVVMLVAARLVATASVRLIHGASLSMSTRTIAQGPRRVARITLHVAYVATMALIALAYNGGIGANYLSTFPSSEFIHVATANAINESVAYLSTTLSGLFAFITRLMARSLDGLNDILLAIPWPVIFLGVGFAGWRSGGILRSLLTVGALSYIGLFGYWEEAISTASLVLAGVFICICLGIPLGIATSKNRYVRSVMIPLLDFMQTLPSFVYLLPAVAFFSLGRPPALVATVIFAIPPLIRLTALGIAQTPEYVKEAMYAHGATPLQTLFKAELPLAIPSIKAGVNQTIMLGVSMVVIASLIGGGGLGYNVLFALQNVMIGEGILAGVAIVFIAIIFDRLAGRDDDSNR